MRYVQHVSGQGEIFPVNAEDIRVWISIFTPPHRDLVLPKSDYRLVDPPAVWRNVTAECEWRKLKDGQCLSHHTGPAWRPEEGCNILVEQTLGYRLRKILAHAIDRRISPDTIPAFIVEREESYMVAGGRLI